MPARWIFDELPPSGARRGDDPAQHAFRPDLATFVREVVQNANDQAIAAPVVAFSGRVIEGDALARFREALDWAALVEHLQATADTRTGARIARTLAAVERSDRLPVLCVEDRNTVGLTGDEDDEASHFRALCKDTLFSRKRDESAGGSYGLGKSVLWAFSGLRTVLFASRLEHDPAPHRSPRLIGRAELPSHATGAGKFVGSGWFGTPTRISGGRTRAESIWSDAADPLLDALGIPRASSSGTSILVVGVRDPSAEDEDDPALALPRLLASIGGHVAADFWPAMTRADGTLAVEVDGRRIDPHADAYAAPLIACLQGAAHATDEPRDDGDVTIRSIALELPRLRDARTSVTGHVDLVVRLADAVDRPGVGRVAAFRGAGMIVKRWDATRLATTLRPFHAVLRCGRARGTSPTDLAVEKFLRAAEPPGHDDWIATPAVKDEYVRGGQAALVQLQDRIFEALREILAPTAHSGTRGPERLRRRFAVKPKPARSGTAGPVGFGALSAELREGRWWFEGEIEGRKGTPTWTAVLAVRQVGEDGSFGDDVPIAQVELDGDAASAEVTQGRARIHALRSPHAVAFRGSTVALRGAHAWLGEVALEIIGTAAAEVEP
jgi:hypothetical protein